MNLSIIILAAGAGTRMYSDLPKVLHRVGGKPLLQHVIDASRALAAAQICVVYGHGGEQVRATLAVSDVAWVEQAQRLGTGHAVAQAMPQVADADIALVLYGDVPLIAVDTLRQVVAAANAGALGLVTVTLADPHGYGRVVRDAAGRVLRIVEQKDASADECAIGEVNTGILAVSAQHLRRWLAALRNDNAQGEYYLTDIIAMAVAEGVAIHTVSPITTTEVLGVNNCAQLAEVERAYQHAQAQRLMLAGVTLRDPARFDLRGELHIGRDVVVDINVVCEGQVTLGHRVRIGPNVYLRDCRLDDDVEVLANSVVEGATVGVGARIGPFARIRPTTQLAAGSHIGNFVEIKQTEVGAGSKINHLSYVGDATVGRNVNIGAGTITCNYDGANKHRTVIEDDVFVGSATQLVAPVTVGAGATIGAGSTISRNAPAGELTLSRVRQETRAGWTRPRKTKC